MSKTKSLKTLSRIQKFQIDEQRKLLTEHLEEEEKLLSERSELIRAFEAEKTFSREQSCIGDFGAYVKRYMQKKELLNGKIAKVREKIEQIRDIIADMFKEQKTFEIVERNRKAAEQKEEEDKTRKMLDEIGTNAYLKKHGVE